MNFSELGLSEPFLRATQALGYENATPIQVEAIPDVLAGRDLIGCAQTGTGKTAAFTLPMLDRLMQTLPVSPAKTPTDDGQRRGPKGSNPRPRAIRALVLSPTRELAVQIGDSLDRYGKYTPLRKTVVYGGVSQHHQVKALRHGVDALVATPGRLLDLMGQGHIDLSKIEILVFDEADQMLDMGFLPALKRIVASVPKRRQTLMFSATMPDAIRQLAQQWLSQPAEIQVAVAAAPAERITQSVHMVDKNRKPDLLSHFLKDTTWVRTLVFSRTKHGADKIVRHLMKKGLHAAAIHGNKSQGARSRALAQFKSQNPPVLVATDIAARGLDINNVSHVVNFDLPETPETYVHRIGRTARAGAEGIAVSFCAGDERGFLKQIERLTRRNIEVEPTVEGFEPTEPISFSTARPSNGYSGANKSRSGGKPRRFGAKPGSSGSADEKPRCRKGSTEPPANFKKGKPSGGPGKTGAPRKRRRSKPAAS
jgi:ATP-dependent RNA helicase RhlE